MGYFNIAYNVYAWFYMVSTAGLPLAVSVMIARADAEGNGARCRKIFRCAIILFSVIGITGASLMAVFSHKLADASAVKLSYLCMLYIAPTLLFVCISSAVRGYYQGYGIMWPTGISQVTEAAGKMTFGLLFAVKSLEAGNPLYVTSACAILGITFGSALSALFCLLVKGFYRIKTENSAGDAGNVLWKMLSIALPVTLSASVMNLTSIADVFIAPGRLQSIGFTQAQATEIFGNYTTLAVSMFNMPSVFIYPIAYAVVPALTSAITKGEIGKSKAIINSAFKVAVIFSLPCSVGLAVLSEDVLKLIFPDQSAILASPMLTVLSASVFLCALVAISNSVLQASGNEKLPIISMTAGAVVKLVSTYYLVNVPRLGRLGIPLGTDLCYITIAALNVAFALCKTKTAVNIFPVFGKPLIASGVCGLTAYYVNEWLSTKLLSDARVLISIAAASAVYFIALFALRGLDKHDISILPKSEKIYSTLKKLKMIN